MNSTMNISNTAVSINPLQTLLDEQKLLEPNLPTMNLCAELLEDINLKLKEVRNEVKNKYQIDLDENLLFLDINKEVLRAQSLMIFLSQGKPLLRPNKEEILANLGSNKPLFETQRLEEESYHNQVIEHQEIIKEYRKHMIDLKHQNKQLKKLIKLYKHSNSEKKPKIVEETTIIRPNEFTNIKEKFRSSEKKTTVNLKKKLEMTDDWLKIKKEPHKIPSEKNKSYASNSKIKLKLESEIQGLDDEIEQLTHQINQYL